MCAKFQTPIRQSNRGSAPHHHHHVKGLLLLWLLPKYTLFFQHTKTQPQLEACCSLYVTLLSISSCLREKRKITILQIPISPVLDFSLFSFVRLYIAFTSKINYLLFLFYYKLARFLLFLSSKEKPGIKQ